MGEVRQCKRCGERYFDGETRCEDECAKGAGSIGCCGGEVVPVPAPSAQIVDLFEALKDALVKRDD